MAAKKTTRRAPRRKAGSGVPKPRKGPTAHVPAILDDAADEFLEASENRPESTADGTLAAEAVWEAGREAYRRNLIKIDRAQYDKDAEIFWRSMQVYCSEPMSETARAAVAALILGAYLIGANADMHPEITSEVKRAAGRRQTDAARAERATDRFEETVVLPIIRNVMQENPSDTWADVIRKAMGPLREKVGTMPETEVPEAWRNPLPLRSETADDHARLAVNLRRVMDKHLK